MPILLKWLCVVNGKQFLKCWSLIIFCLLELDNSFQCKHMQKDYALLIKLEQKCDRTAERIDLRTGSSSFQKTSM